MKNSNQQLNQYNESIPGRRILRTNNSILVIRVYYKDGLWVFDDDRVGLNAEPFVGGADDFIDYVLRMTGKYEEARRNGFSAVFSNREFMGAMARLDFNRFDYTGSIYRPHGFADFENQFGTSDVWLCPALNLYYQDSPERIYLSLKV